MASMFAEAGFGYAPHPEITPNTGLALELGEGGKDAESQAAVGGGGVNLRAAPVSTFNPMPRSRSASAVMTKCLRSRPRRSSFQSTSVLPGCNALRQAVRPGRAS